MQFLYFFLFIQMFMYFVYKTKLHEDDPIHILVNDDKLHITRIYSPIFSKSKAAT